MSVQRDPASPSGLAAALWAVRFRAKRLVAHSWGWKPVSSLQASRAKGTRKSHSLPLQGSMGRNNSRQAPVDSFLPSAFRKMCLRKPSRAAKVLLACSHYQLLQNLIKKDDRGFCHGRWEPSFQRHLCLQNWNQRPSSLAEAGEHVALLRDEPGPPFKCWTRSSVSIAISHIKKQHLLYIKGFKLKTKANT